MKRRTLIVSIALHALLLMIVYIFQSMIFPYLRLAGLAPLLLPIVSTGVAVYEGRYAGGITGIFAGILCDVSFNEPTGVFTVLLTFSGLLIGTMADTVITRGFATFFLSCVVVLAVSALVQMFPLVFFEEVPPRVLWATALWQTVYSLVLAIPIWFFVRALGKRAQRVSPPGRPL
jgi:rod shape-determining protein MreD